MFTGIIEDVGTVSGVSGAGSAFIITIETTMSLADVKIGDSISINGVCLTVVETKRDSFSAEVSPETLSRTTLAGAQRGIRVNLEKALQVGGRLGGHLVQGHVDGVGSISGIRRESDSVLITISPPDGLMKYFVEKGSVAVDGISLTVNSVLESEFTLNIIGHTAQNTVLVTKGVGEPVNLEVDILGKYVERFIQNKIKNDNKGVTLKKLSEEGFI
jgi:riboflavin synthase